LPAFVGNAETAWGRALAYRRVGDQSRILSLTLDNIVFETAIPAALGPSAEATLVRIWGDVARGKRYGSVFGLYWDEADQRLYWSSGTTYNASAPEQPSVGYTLLDDDSGRVVSVEGPWAFRGRGCKATMGGVTSIPSWFADSFCNGQRLGAGFGGYWSVVITGPAHMGPALCAFEPPGRANEPKSSLTFTNLVGYPFNAKAYTTPDRCHRDTDYRTEFDGWNPLNGVGYWSWTDWIWQGGVWIDRPDKHGVVFFPTLGRGRTWYESSTLHAERGAHAWYVYDPMDLASVAKGERRQWEIQPTVTWDVQYEGIRYPLSRWRDEPAHMVTGATYDDVQRRLYLAIRFAAHTGSASQHVVYVYEVR
jgi:hypothetical protein